MFFNTTIKTVMIICLGCALFVVGLGLQAPLAYGQQISETFSQRILVIIDSTDTFAVPAYERTTEALQYFQMPYETLDLGQSSSLPGLQGFSAIVLLTEKLARLTPGQNELLIEYVGGGGNLVIGYRGWNSMLNPILGIEEQETFPQILLDEEGGISFQAEFFPGQDEFAFGQTIAPNHTTYNFDALNPEAQVIATAADGRPIVWSYLYENGKTLYWNTQFATLLETEEFAGNFLIQSILNIQPLSIIAIADSQQSPADYYSYASRSDTGANLADPLQSDITLTWSAERAQIKLSQPGIAQIRVNDPFRLATDTLQPDNAEFLETFDGDSYAIYTLRLSSSQYSFDLINNNPETPIQTAQDNELPVAGNAPRPENNRTLNPGTAANSGLQNNLARDLLGTAIVLGALMIIIILIKIQKTHTR